ncbi:hypothetical protein [Dactylosporangium sp. NPDC049140]|uniref:hypothetical protein n=1 Tax=Dactylosporangium sp. NPDC049140 TaxID=3155647 RepID=UPI0033DBA276
MRRSRTIGRLVIVSVTPLLLAVVGLFHPTGLNPSTAHMWATMHIWLLPAFPLLTLGLIVPLWGRPGRGVAGVATVVAWLAAAAFAALYTGLDAVAGIAAGTVQLHAAGGQDVGPSIAALFGTADSMGHAGVRALAVAVVAAAVALAVRHGWRVLPGTAVLLVCTYEFYDSHIFYPRGVLAMAGYAVGFVLLTWPAVRPRSGSVQRSPEVLPGPVHL